jgi:hypothetical protein
MAEYTNVQLMEKIIRAKIALEKARSAPHRTSCPMEDPESYAPCNCGASAANGPIREALDALKL